ncbi:hypothetical protein IMZ48_01250 [Candidatus Bathyarchaeota archaeon]|nr:hypothetical protein [Candidatus Bathyarchaeota archaeon]
MPQPQPQAAVPAVPAPTQRKAGGRNCLTACLAALCCCCVIEEGCECW